MADKYRYLTYGELFVLGDQLEDTLTNRWVAIPGSWVTNKATFEKDSVIGRQNIKIRRLVGK